MQKFSFQDWYVIHKWYIQLFIFSQAEAWCNLEVIEIVSVLMYVGEDPAGRQLSGIFGRSDMIRKFISDHGRDVHSLMDKYTSIFKYVFTSIRCNT